MTVAYQAGTANTPWDLLSGMQAFALAHGFTVNQYSAGDPGTGVLRLARNGKYYNLYADETDGAQIRLAASTGFVASAALGSQPDEANCTTSNIGDGPYVTTHFFVGDHYFHVALEIVAGEYRHFSFGELEKLGSYTGGEYGAAVFWDHYRKSSPGDERHQSWIPCGGRTYGAESSSYSNAKPASVRADFTATPQWHYAGNANALADRAVSSYWRNVAFNEIYLGRIFADYGTNDFNLRTITAPIWLFALDETLKLYRPLGWAPGIRQCAMNFHEPGDEIDNTWKVFPLVRKNGTGDLANSGTYGLAYRIA